MMPLVKFEFVDALRGWAILGVVLVHSSQWAVPSSKVFDALAKEGARGVQLFFVISSFTLFLSLTARCGREPRYILNFFVRRFFRIAPLFYLSLIVYTFLNGLGARYFAPDGVAWWFFPLTVSFLNGWMPQTINSVVPGGWSIAAEAMFYLLLPWLFTKVTNIKSALIYSGVSLLFAQILNMILMSFLEGVYPSDQLYLLEIFIRFWFFSQLPVFLLGILTFHLLNKYRDGLSKTVATNLLVVACLSLMLLTGVQDFFNALFENFLYGIAFCMLLMSQYFNPSHILVNPITIWLGKVSFSIYLVHFVVVRAFNHFLPQDQFFTGDLGALCGYMLVLVVTAPIAFITYLWIEMPGIEFGRKLTKKFVTADDLA